MTDSPRPPFIWHSDGSIRRVGDGAPKGNVLDRVSGVEMTFVRVDHQTRLQFGAFEIVIECPFRLTTPDGAEHDLDPAVRAGLGPFLDLYPDTLVTATVDADASLRLRFASGASLDVSADGRFEAWHVAGTDGFLVVCTPGGNLAVWGGSVGEERVGLFRSAAGRFCALVERDSLDLGELLASLLRLVDLGLRLPDVEPESELELDDPDRLQADADAVARNLGRILGDIDYYSVVFDPRSLLSAPVTGSLVDDMVDIYRDVRRGLHLADTGHQADATWHWRFSMRMHWGIHATGAIRTLFRVVADEHEPSDGCP